MSRRPDFQLLSHIARFAQDDAALSQVVGLTKEDHHRSRDRMRVTAEAVVMINPPFGSRTNSETASSIFRTSTRLFTVMRVQGSDKPEPILSYNHKETASFFDLKDF